MTTSPLLTGGAGFDFEDGVAAVYLTALSLEGGVLGLGQFTATPIALQRAGSGAPLDDVIVTGVDVAGDSSTLHLQVKFPGGDWGGSRHCLCRCRHWAVLALSPAGHESHHPIDRQPLALAFWNSLVRSRILG